MRSGGDGVKIVPRVLVEGWTMADFREVFASETSMIQVADFLVERLKVREGGETSCIFTVYRYNFTYFYLTI